MKYIKVIFGLGLIPLGVFVGSYISIRRGQRSNYRRHYRWYPVLHNHLVWTTQEKRILAQLLQSRRAASGQQ